MLFFEDVEKGYRYAERERHNPDKSASSRIYLSAVVDTIEYIYGLDDKSFFVSMNPEDTQEFFRKIHTHHPPSAGRTCPDCGLNGNP